MTTPAKPPAPMEPLKPCPFCGREAILCKQLVPPLAACSCSPMEENLCPLAGGLYLVEEWNRRAAPSPSDGEVGELVERLKTRADEWDSVGVTGDAAEFREAAAALSRQSAELAEAREMTQRMVNMNADNAVGRVTAEVALLALGCKLGPEGWMRPCRFVVEEEPVIRYCYEAPFVDCDKCDGTGWLPIPGAGAKGDNHE